MIGRSLLGAAMAAAAADSASAGTSSVSGQDAGLEAWVEARETDGRLKLVSHAQAEAAAHVEYTLEVERRSSAGRSSTRQGGQADLEAGEPSRLSVSGVDYRDGTVRATLTVRAEDGETATYVYEGGGED